MSTPVPPPYQPQAPDATGATPAPAPMHPPAYPGQAGQPYPSPVPHGAYPAGPAWQNPPAPARNGFGIAAMVLAIVPFTALVGVIMSIIALVRSRGTSNGKVFGIVGIIVGTLWLVIGVVIGIAAANIYQTCQDLGPGTHTVNGMTYTCS